jgi:hypothetical protein
MMKAKAKVPTNKQKIASQLNWDKMQLVSAVGHLKLLLAKYGYGFGELEQLEFIEQSVREGMQDTALANEIKGNYREQIPYEESRMFKRNAKQFVESRKIEGN